MSTGYIASSAPCWVGQAFGHPLVISTELDEACGGLTWPRWFYEVKADDRDVLGSFGNTVRVKTCAVQREIPPGEVFGPRAAELVAFLDELPRFSWLKPGREPGERWIAEQVTRHFEALVVRGFPHRIPCRVIRDPYDVAGITPSVLGTDENFVLPGDKSFFDYEPPKPPRSTACAATGDAAAHAVFAKAWDPLWRSAQRVTVRRAAASFDPSLAPLVDEILGSSRDYGRVGASFFVFDLAQGRDVNTALIKTMLVPLMEDAIARIPEERRKSRELHMGLAGVVAGALITTWENTWHTVYTAMAIARLHAMSLVNDSPQPNPFGAILEVWRAGCMWLGPLGGSVVVAMPPPVPS